MFRPVRVRQYLALMKAKGHNASAVLAGSGITEAMLAAPDFLADFEQARVVVSNVIALTGDHGIGLEVGAKTELVNLGLVGYAMMSSRSLRQTVEHWVSYSNALIGMPLQVRLDEKAPDDWSLVFCETSSLESIRHFCIEEQLVMAYKLGCDLAPTRPTPALLELAYPAPRHHERYGHYFGCPIRFNCRDNRLTFFSPRLDYPLRGNDEELNQLCSRQCELVLRQICHRSPFADEVRRILSRSADSVPTIEEAARKLKISARTLRRHLQADGYTYQQLVNHFRAARAKEYLDSSLAAKEVSYRLGFSEPNSFHRAFKAWTGQTVRQYLRTEHRAGRRAAV